MYKNISKGKPVVDSSSTNWDLFFFFLLVLFALFQKQRTKTKKCRTKAQPYNAYGSIVSTNNVYNRCQVEQYGWYIEKCRTNFIFFRFFHFLHLVEFKFVWLYYNSFIRKNQRPSETQRVSGGRLLELSFMLYSGMSWNLTLWRNVSVWVMTFWLWVITPVTIRPETLFFVLPYGYSLLLAVTLNFQIVMICFFGLFIGSV